MMSEIQNKAVWPGWTTTRLIGRGSFGAVYEIERDVFGHTEKAALKCMTIPQNDGDVDELRDSGYDDESITESLKIQLETIVNEYALMRKMNGHTNVVNCDDFSIVEHQGELGWDILIKMELLTPLSKVIGPEVNETQVIKIAGDMCNALSLCKQFDIVHRDVKPANIFVSYTGDYKLGDFGVAKAMERTAGGTKIGTYEYMAPEVYFDKPYNHSADVYSLGLVLYWLLNNRRGPFVKQGDRVPTVLEKEEARKRRLSGETIPAPVNGSEELKRIVLKACAYNPKDRYQSAEEMKADLKALEISAYTGGKANTSSQYAQPEKTESAPIDQAQPINAQPDDDATVMRWQSPRPVDDSEATIGVWNKPEPPKAGNIEAYGSQKEKPKKRILPIVAAILVVLAVVLLFPCIKTKLIQFGMVEAAVGDTVIFGTYEQDNYTSDGKENIKWLVLAKEDNKILVISKYALDCQQYNTSYYDVTWGTCTLRKWLNDTFLKEAFSTKEQRQILNTTVSADKNPEFSTNPGYSTEDKVFLLSVNEVNKYFTNDKARKCAPTAYAKAQGAYYKTASGEATCWWWLRSPGATQFTAASVYIDGSVGGTGSSVHRDHGCVRPALWINLDS